MYKMSEKQNLSTDYLQLKVHHVILEILEYFGHPCGL